MLQHGTESRSRAKSDERGAAGPQAFDDRREGGDRLTPIAAAVVDGDDEFAAVRRGEHAGGNNARAFARRIAATMGKAGSERLRSVRCERGSRLAYRGRPRDPNRGVDRDSLSVEVRQASADQVNRALRRSALVGIPASSLLALILGSSVPLPRRLAFMALVWLADLVMFSTSGRYLRRRQRGELIDRYWQGPFSASLLTFASGQHAPSPEGPMRSLALDPAPIQGRIS